MEVAPFHAERQRGGGRAEGRADTTKLNLFCWNISVNWAPDWQNGSVCITLYWKINMALTLRELHKYSFIEQIELKFQNARCEVFNWQNASQPINLCSQGTKCGVHTGAGDDDDVTRTVLSGGMTPLLLESSGDTKTPTVSPPPQT